MLLGVLVLVVGAREALLRADPLPIHRQGGDVLSCNPSRGNRPSRISNRAAACPGLTTRRFRCISSSRSLTFAAFWLIRADFDPVLWINLEPAWLAAFARPLRSQALWTALNGTHRAKGTGESRK